MDQQACQKSVWVDNGWQLCGHAGNYCSDHAEQESPVGQEAKEDEKPEDEKPEDEGSEKSE